MVMHRKVATALDVMYGSYMVWYGMACYAMVCFDAVETEMV